MPELVPLPTLGGIRNFVKLVARRGFRAPASLPLVYHIGPSGLVHPTLPPPGWRAPRLRLFTDPYEAYEVALQQALVRQDQAMHEFIISTGVVERLKAEMAAL